MNEEDLVLERRDQPDGTAVVGRPGGGGLIIAPPVSEDYWAYRVKVCEGQAVLGFPKMGTIGIGFAVEEDWNSNLPYRFPARDILTHIQHNAGPLPAEDWPLAYRAIEMIQEAAYADRGEDPLELPHPHDTGDEFVYRVWITDESRIAALNRRHAIKLAKLGRDEPRPIFRKPLHGDTWERFEITEADQ